ncbi:hypothetical protein NDU88_007175 [Pleurodeles waltl]|uniref:Uncharacterized protein n=1 Tax=Pleurodeles waltl TaxID=8319 RepID=A0AAV7N5M2_PLEWA|nr:hypothetical protein NDU88_007175 [Pleurodeles waltl]
MVSFIAPELAYNKRKGTGGFAGWEFHVPLSAVIHSAPFLDGSRRFLASIKTYKEHFWTPLLQCDDEDEQRVELNMNNGCS